MTAAPRVRMAPSPTGFFHVGSARTALFNWLFARQHGGTYVLRIEDTDAERNRPEHVEMILSAHRWLGLDWDEGPISQAGRAERHAEAARQLLDSGHLYYCDCTREAVDARAKERGGPPGYDRFCRDRELGPGEGRALRFRVPLEGSTTVTDLVRGEPTFEHANIEDFVVVRANGTPVFILANVVDDLDMGITHVIRGEDHLSNTPKAMLLWQALGGGELPVFAHLPLLVNDKRQKLSKRRDKVALEEYAAQGYLPEAMVNYLALLGWAPREGDEILSRDELIRAFRLEEVVSSPAFFDGQKLAHVNGEWIRRLPREDFNDRVLAFVRSSVLDRMGGLVQERVATLAEAPAMIDFFFVEQPSIDRATFDKVLGAETAPAVLDAAIASYEALDEWVAPALHQATLAAGESIGLKLNKAQAPVRVAVTGRSVGPPLFESLEVLGRDRTLRRLRAVRAQLG